MECLHSGFFPQDVVLVAPVWKTPRFGPEGLGHSIGHQRASFHIPHGQLLTISQLLLACPPYIVPMVLTKTSSWASIPALALRLWSADKLGLIDVHRADAIIWLCRAVDIDRDPFVVAVPVESVHINPRTASVGFRSEALPMISWLVLSVMTFIFCQLCEGVFIHVTWLVFSMLANEEGLQKMEQGTTEIIIHNWSSLELEASPTAQQWRKD